MSRIAKIAGGALVAACMVIGALVFHGGSVSAAVPSPIPVPPQNASTELVAHKLVLDRDEDSDTYVDGSGDLINFRVGDTLYARMWGGALESTSGARPSIRFTTATNATTPNMHPDSDDPDTGLAGCGADCSALVAGGATQIKCIEGVADQCILQQQNNASSPTLAFGDGDTGIYEVADDSLAISRAGVANWYISGANGIASANGNGAMLRVANASSTTPTLLPNQSNLNSGIGAAAAGSVSVITGGVERLRVEDAALYLFSIAKDVGATCSTGEVAFDTGGATQELCRCASPNTWTCWSATTASGPTD